MLIPMTRLIGGELDDAAAQALELGPGEGQLAVGEQDDQDAGDAEDRPGGSGADLDEEGGVAQSRGHDDVPGHAEQVAGDAGEQVDGNHAEGAEERFAEDAEVPQAPHVGGEVDAGRRGRRWR